jgi:hypothetical protein
MVLAALTSRGSSFLCSLFSPSFGGGQAMRISTLTVGVTLALCVAQWQAMTFLPTSAAAAGALQGGDWCTQSVALFTCSQCIANGAGGSSKCSSTGTNFACDQTVTFCSQCNLGQAESCGGDLTTFTNTTCAGTGLFVPFGCARMYDPFATDSPGGPGSSCPNNCP